MILRLFILSSCILIANAAKLPTVFKRCVRKSDEGNNVCLMKAVEDGIKKLANGLPSLGIPPLEPLSISEFTLGNGGSAVNMKLKFTDVKIHGITNITFSRQTSLFTDDSVKLTSRSLNPYLLFEGDYEADGKLLLVPVKSKGKARFHLDEVDGTSTLAGIPQMKNGKNYLNLKEYIFKFDVKKLTMEFDNLIANRDVGNATLKAMNDNWQDILKELKPGFEEVLSTVFKHIADRLYKKVPMDEIYPLKL